MAQETITKKEAVQELVGLTGEDANEYQELPLKALIRLLASEKARVEAQAEAEKAKATIETAKAKAGTRGRKATTEPKYTKKAKAVTRLLEGEASGQVHDLAEWFVDHVGEQKQIKGSNPDFYGMKCLLRALYSRRLLSWDMMNTLRNAMEETE